MSINEIHEQKWQAHKTRVIEKFHSLLEQANAERDYITTFGFQVDGLVYISEWKNPGRWSDPKEIKVFY